MALRSSRGTSSASLINQLKAAANRAASYRDAEMDYEYRNGRISSEDYFAYIQARQGTIARGTVAYINMQKKLDSVEKDATEDRLAFAVKNGQAQPAELAKWLEDNRLADMDPNSAAYLNVKSTVNSLKKQQVALEERFTIQAYQDMQYSDARGADQMMLNFIREKVDRAPDDITRAEWQNDYLLFEKKVEKNKIKYDLRDTMNEIAWMGADNVGKAQVKFDKLVDLRDTAAKNEFWEEVLRLDTMIGNTQNTLAGHINTQYREKEQARAKAEKEVFQVADANWQAFLEYNARTSLSKEEEIQNLATAVYYGFSWIEEDSRGRARVVQMPSRQEQLQNKMNQSVETYGVDGGQSMARAAKNEANMYDDFFGQGVEGTLGANGNFIPSTDEKGFLKINYEQLSTSGFDSSWTTSDDGSEGGYNRYGIGTNVVRSLVAVDSQSKRVYSADLKSYRYVTGAEIAKNPSKYFTFDVGTNKGKTFEVQTKSDFKDKESGMEVKMDKAGLKINGVVLDKLKYIDVAGEMYVIAPWNDKVAIKTNAQTMNDFDAIGKELATKAKVARDMKLNEEQEKELYDDNIAKAQHYAPYIQKAREELLREPTPPPMVETKRTGVVSGVGSANLNVRETGNIGSRILDKIPEGTSLTILGEKDGWLQTDRGWVSSQFVKDMGAVAPTPVDFKVQGYQSPVQTGVAQYSNLTKNQGFVDPVSLSKSGFSAYSSPVSPIKQTQPPKQPTQFIGGLAGSAINKMSSLFKK